jgi:hypothetical protein
MTQSPLEDFERGLAEQLERKVLGALADFADRLALVERVLAQQEAWLEQAGYTRCG